MSSLPICLTTLLTLSLQLITALPWVAVVDQIHEPWLLLIGEDGRQREVHRAQCEAGLREGMWVRYHPKSQRVTRLKSPALRLYALEVERSLQERLKRLTHDAEP